MINGQYFNISYECNCPLKTYCSPLNLSLGLNSKNNIHIINISNKSCIPNPTNCKTQYDAKLSYIADAISVNVTDHAVNVTDHATYTGCKLAKAKKITNAMRLFGDLQKLESHCEGGRGLLRYTCLHSISFRSSSVFSSFRYNRSLVNNFNTINASQNENSKTFLYMRYMVTGER